MRLRTYAHLHLESLAAQEHYQYKHGNPDPDDDEYHHQRDDLGFCEARAEARPDGALISRLQQLSFTTPVPDPPLSSSKYHCKAESLRHPGTCELVPFLPTLLITASASAFRD